MRKQKGGISPQIQITDEPVICNNLTVYCIALLPAPEQLSMFALRKPPGGLLKASNHTIHCKSKPRQLEPLEHVRSSFLHLSSIRHENELVPLSHQSICNVNYCLITGYHHKEGHFHPINLTCRELREATTNSRNALEMSTTVMVQSNAHFEFNRKGSSFQAPRS